MTATDSTPASGAPYTYWKSHAHFFIATVVGIAASALAYRADTLAARCLIGWNVGVWFYLCWTGWTMSHSGSDRLERVARAQAEGASTVLAVVAAGALASFGAVVVELAAAKSGGPRHALPQVLLTVSTVAASWTLVPTLFALNYASIYHVSDDHDGGLRFPEEEPDFEPDYSDFLYVAFTIAVASQTSDVVITNRSMRRLVLLQSVLSFVFNTTVLAFTINIAASLI